MKRIFPLLFCFSNALALAQPAKVCDPDPAVRAEGAVAKRLRQLIVEKKFGAVQDELDDRLKRYERGELNDLNLYGDILAAVKTDASIEPLLAQWVAEQPASFFAHLLKGTYHTTIGFAKRGRATADKTSKEQFVAMEAEFKKGVTELQAARTIRPASALTYAQLISVATAVAGPPAVRGLLAEAEKNDPLNLSARWQAIGSFNPKWGGTFEDLDDLIVRAKAAAVPSARLRYLQYSVEMEKAGFTNFFAREKTKAIAYYRIAAALCPVSAPWSAISNAAYEIEDWNTVKEATTQVLLLYPKAAKDLQRRGWASEKLGKMDDALQDYLAAAELGEAWSQNKLGYWYMTGTNVPRDYQRAKSLLESAVAKGVPTAQANLDWVNNQLGIK